MLVEEFLKTANINDPQFINLLGVGIGATTAAILNNKFVQPKIQQRRERKFHAKQQEAALAELIMQGYPFY